MHNILSYFLSTKKAEHCCSAFLSGWQSRKLSGEPAAFPPMAGRDNRVTLHPEFKRNQYLQDIF